jgi:hypothetical protein
MLYSFWYWGCCGGAAAVAIEARAGGRAGAQLRANDLEEFGMVSAEDLPFGEIWARTEVACAGLGKVRKQ